MFTRTHAGVLKKRLAEPRRFIQVVAGPRQVGKTTLVRQVLERSRLEAHYASADEPTLRGRHWLEEQWDTARLKARDAGRRGAVLAIDEAGCVRLGCRPLLANAASAGLCETFYWLDRNHEVDFVVRTGRVVTAIEVKSARRRGSLPGIAAFDAAFRPKRKLLVGGDGIPIEESLGKPVDHWVGR